MEHPNEKQLSVFIRADVLRSVKILAVHRGVTLRSLVESMLTAGLLEHNRQQMERATVGQDTAGRIP